MTKLDITKPYATRDGREAAAIRGPDGRLYGWFRRGDDYYPASWDKDGLYAYGGVLSSCDLVNISEKRTITVWINVYEDCLGQVYSTREQADFTAGSNRIACLKIEREYTVGEGL